MQSKPPARAKAPEISVYDFVDYRAYLRAAYHAEKERRSAFSYRLFSRLAGLKSPNFLKRVIDGERNLSPRTIAKFARALGLDKDATAFFTSLVHFTQADSIAEKSRALSRLDAVKYQRCAGHFSDDLTRYFAHWYLPAIHALAQSAEFRDDPTWIAAQLRPAITPSEAASALNVLVALGVLGHDEATGKIVVRAPQIVIRNEALPQAIAALHRESLELAVRAFETVPEDKRALHMVSACVSQELALSIKDRLQQISSEIAAEVSRAERDGTVVYQLSLAWFPLSAWPARASKPSPSKSPRRAQRTS